MVDLDVQPSYGEDVDLILYEITSPSFVAYPPYGAQNEKDVRSEEHTSELQH